MRFIALIVMFSLFLLSVLFLSTMAWGDKIKNCIREVTLDSIIELINKINRRMEGTK